MKPRRVVVVSPVHAGDDIRVARKEALSLVEAGYEVLLLARMGPGTVRLPGIQYVPLPIEKRRLHRFLSLPGLAWKSLRLRGDVYHLHNPDTLPIGLLLRLCGKRVIYDTHEDFHQRILIRQWIPERWRQLVANLVHLAEVAATHVFEKVIVTQGEVARRLHGRAIVIENPPVTTGRVLDDARAFADGLDPGECLRMVYVGSIDETRGLFRMIDLVEAANRDRPVRLWLIGEIPPELMQECQARPGWKWVDYLGFVEQSQAYGYVSRSDVGLVLLDRAADFPFSSPNKLFEYLLFGVPFIASDFAKWREALGPVRAGWFVDPEDAAGILAVVSDAAAAPSARKEAGQRGREFVLREFNWESEARKLTRAYDEMFSRGVPPRRP